MQNIKPKIKTQQKDIKETSNPEHPKMHKSKNTCPLNRDCLLKNILYIATITSDKKNYIPRNYKEMPNIKPKIKTQ